MEAKEKAKSLCEQMWLIVGGPWVDKPTYNKQYDKAKQCALIAVEEMRHYAKEFDEIMESEFSDSSKKGQQYLDEVKKEIEAL